MLALVLALSAPIGSGSAVVTLPLLADGSVSEKEAHGITALIREATATGGFAKLLNDSADDVKQAQKCQRDLACLGAIADVRGADLILSGTVTTAPDGLRVSVLVVQPKAKVALRRAETTLQGNAGDTLRIDRLARTILNPAALVGTLAITGDEGAAVELDGKPLGALPLDEIHDVPEGDHTVAVKKRGYEDFVHGVHVEYPKTTEVHAILLGANGAAPSTPGRAIPNPAPSHVDAYVVGGIAGALVVAGAVAGGLSLKDALDVETRAKASQLAFPKDAGLVERGRIEALTADGCYAAAVLAAGGAVALYLLDGGGP